MGFHRNLLSPGETPVFSITRSISACQLTGVGSELSFTMITFIFLSFIEARLGFGCMQA